ncbi:MAG: cobaltochelatase subunit CobN [Opitutales bacterium]|nr:cobaltochelatase subunit CobN [Opitutales bacterium]
MKKVILIFSHNSLGRRWNQLSASLRACGVDLLVLGQHADIDWNAFIECQLPQADVVYMECSRNTPHFSRLIDATRNLRFVLAGDIETSAELPDTFSSQVDRFHQYIANGSLNALENAVFYLIREQSKALGDIDQILPEVSEPQPAQLCAIGDPRQATTYESVETYLSSIGHFHPGLGIVPILYGRRYWIADDLEVVSILIRRIEAEGFTPLPVFCDFNLANRINDPSHPIARLLNPYRESIVVLLNLAFSNASGDSRPDAFFTGIGKPVLQLIRDYTHTEKTWQESERGNLIGMTYSFSVAQPETLGTIEPHLVAVNAVEKASLPKGETPLSKPIEERINRLMARIRRWHLLQILPNAEKRIGIVLHSSPCKGVEATLGSAAGLDAAQSTVDLMRRMQESGYSLGKVPEDGTALVRMILEHKAHSEFRWTNTDMIVEKGGVLARVDETQYRKRFDHLPLHLQKAINDAWEPFPGQGMVHIDKNGTPSLLVTGIRFGNVTVMIEAKRGCYGPKCNGEVCRILHQPDIPPTHHWLATAWYMQDNFDAIVQMGAESALDYLPGKSIALSEHCFPDLSLGELPRIFPYIMDSIGEGLIAKRRGKGVIIDHLTPPVKAVNSNDGSFETLLELHRQLRHARTHEHVQRAKTIAIRMREELVSHGWLDRNANESSFDTMLDALARRIQSLRTKMLAAGKHVLGRIPDENTFLLYLAEAKRTQTFEAKELRRRLDYTSDELDHVLSGLDGRFIPSGQAGAISSGRENLLPTGRNIYAMDLKSLPTPAAWEIGMEMGSQLLLKYFGEEQAFPESIGVTLWSSDAFMAEGELTSQCLWLLGCKPRWNHNGQVAGIEVMPLESLTLEIEKGKQCHRPRVDVVVRMSGVVRDLLEPVYMLIDDAVTAVGELDEPEDQNLVRKHIHSRLEELSTELQTLHPSELLRLANARLFTDIAGSYGVGVGLAVDASAWKSGKDLANAYVNWTGGICGREVEAVVRKTGTAPVMREFGQQIKGIDIAYQRAISSKYDALSAGCYSAYQGGMAVTKQAFGGKSAKLYWGDSQTEGTTKVRGVAEELDEALLTRLMTEDWIDSRLADGYDGAGDLSGLVNTLFAWSATTGLVEKRHFDLVVRRIIDNEDVRKKLLEHNVYALEEISRRLLEAQSRGLWAADSDAIEIVQQAMLELEGTIEDRTGPVTGEFQGTSVDIKLPEDVERWKWNVDISDRAADAPDSMVKKTGATGESI